MVLSLLLLGCSEPVVQRPNVQEMDSAGVRIVTSAAASWVAGEEWTIDEQPTLQIGVSEGNPDYQFGQIGRVLRLANGHIVVTDEQTQVIRIFDARGRLVGAVGGRGEGPGEYSYITSIAPVGADSFFVFDGVLHRATFYSNDGVMSRVLTVPVTRTRYRSPDFYRHLPDGRFVAIATFNPPTTPGYVADRGGYWQAVAIFDSLGVMVDSVGEFVAARCPGLVSSCDRSPFAPYGHLQISDTHIVHGYGDRIDIGVYDFDGTQRMRIRRPVEPLRIEAATRDSILAALLAQADPKARRELRKLFETVVMDSVMPAIAYIRPDRVGNIWVGEVHEVVPTRELFTSTSPKIASVFDSAGVYLGSVVTPRGLMIYEIGDDYVLGIWRDENDVDYVRMHALRKGKSGG